MKFLLVCFISLLTMVPPMDVRAESPRASLKQDPPRDAAYDATINEIQQTLGIVPSFVRTIPKSGLPGAWAAFKAIQLNPNTALPPKYKELLGLAVASQMPCTYCTFFHTEAAKLNGATQEELNEAITLAAMSRQWSTHFTGAQTDLMRFREEVARIMTTVKARAENRTAEDVVITPMITTAEEAYKDMEATLGLVPEFARTIPKAALPGMWGELKAVAFNPKSAIPPKYKDLISLGVSAQIPCPYCVSFDTESARLNGATEEELHEAVAVAGSSRHWSTIINGAQTDEAKFRKEMTKAFSYLKAQGEKGKKVGQ